MPFWGLKANWSNMVTDTNFKFNLHDTRDSPHTIPLKIVQKWAWPTTRDPLYFWALNAHCSNVVKYMDFKFDLHVPRVSPDMTH